MFNYFDDVLNIVLRLRRATGLSSDYKLARLLNVSAQTVSFWRDGQRFPNYENCRAIARLLNEPLPELLAQIEEARHAARPSPRNPTRKPKQHPLL